MRKRILFEAGKENITGTIIGTNTEKKSDFIFLHGAGKSTKEKAHGFFDTLLFKTIPNITTFDFSGHGESSGTLKKSSLQKRIFETKTAIDLYTTKSQLTVCGTSMGVLQRLFANQKAGKKVLYYNLWRTLRETSYS